MPATDDNTNPTAPPATTPDTAARGPIPDTQPNDATAAGNTPYGANEAACRIRNEISADAVILVPT